MGQPRSASPARGFEPRGERGSLAPLVGGLLITHDIEFLLRNTLSKASDPSGTDASRPERRIADPMAAVQESCRHGDASADPQQLEDFPALCKQPIARFVAFAEHRDELARVKGRRNAGRTTI
jgi:hypothetical protein